MQTGRLAEWVTVLAAFSVVTAGGTTPMAGQQASPSAKLQTVPDAQVESNVLRALAAHPELAKQAISSSTVYGVVTLTGSVPDEATRTLAEDVVSRTAGVGKVVDELTLGPESNASPAQGSSNSSTSPGTAPAAEPSQEQAPVLMSDGTMAPPENTHGGADPSATEQAGSAESQGPPVDGSTSSGPYPPAQQTGPDQAQGGYPTPQAGYPEPRDGQYPRVPPIYPSRSPYSQAAAGQPGGVPVQVEAGTSLLVRIDGGIDSKRAQPGAVWTGTVARDVVSGGYVAIPRGAQVQGVITDASGSGALRGYADLGLQLTSVTLAGNTYALNTGVWQRAGGDKTVRTVNSALGLGVLGAIVGGVAGGGAGAAIGAGVGGAAGVGASAASGSTRVLLPPESVLSFRLAQPVDLATVSQAEMARLASVEPAYPQQYGPGYGRPAYPPPPAYFGAYYGYPYPYGRVYYAPYRPRFYRFHPY